MQNTEPKFDPNRPFVEVSSQTDPEPKFDPNKPFNEVKKKDDTTSDPSLESGTTDPGSADSSQPAKKESDPSKGAIEGQFDDWAEKQVQEFQKAYESQLSQEIDSLQNKLDADLKSKYTPGTQDFLDKRYEYEKQINDFSQKRSKELLDQSNAALKSKLDTEAGKINKTLNKFEVLQERRSKKESPQVKKELSGSLNDPFGIGETIARQIISGFTDQIPKAFAQASEVGVSAMQPANMDEFIKRNKSVEFQRYVRENSDLKWYESFDIDKSLPVYRDKFIQDENLREIQQNINRKQPDIVQRRLELEKYVQQQNKESQVKLGSIPQSYKEVGSVPGAVQYAANLAAQGAWQIPLVIATKGMSGLAMEAAEVYDQQLEQIAAEKNISREEVIKQNLDKPAEGQFYAVAAAGLDRLSAGGLLDLVKKGGSSAAKKMLAVTTETLTEPTQGMLEEMGGAKGAGLSVGDAFEKAWTVNLSKRIDESAGGFFGSAGPVMLSNESSKPVDQVVQEKVADISINDTAKIDEAATEIINKVKQEGVPQADEIVDAPKVEVTPPPVEAQEITGEATVTKPESKSPEGQVQEGEVVDQGIEAGGSLTEDTVVATPDQEVTQQPDYNTQLEEIKEVTTSIDNLRKENPNQFKKNGEPKAGAKITEQYRSLVDDLANRKQGIQAAMEAEFTNRAQQENEISRQETQKLNEEFQARQDELNQYIPEDERAENEIFDKVNATINEAKDRTLTTEEVQFLNDNAFKPSGYTFDTTGSLVKEDQPTKVFVYGTLTDPATRKEALGEDVAITEASTKGQVTKVGDKPNFTEGEQSVPGQVMNLNPEQVAKLDKWEADYDRKEITLDNGEKAFVYTLKPDKPPSEPPPPKKTDSDKPEGRQPGIRETVRKLREESNLASELKEDISQFEKYTERKQSEARKEAQAYIEKEGEDKALLDAGKFKWGRSQEQKIAVLSELAERFSTQFKQALKSGDEKAQTAAYTKFMEAMDLLSANITDTAQALSYLNLVGTIFETKAGATRFAKNQIEESREAALRNYQPLIDNAKQIIEEFDKLKKEDFMQSKRVQELIKQYTKPKSERSQRAAKQVQTAAEKLKQVWESHKTMGIAWDPKSQAKKDLALQKAVIDYIRAVIKKILVDTGEKIQSIKNDVIAEVKEFGKGIGLEIKDSDLSDIVDEQISETQISETKKKYKGDLKKAAQDFISGDIKSKEDLISKIVESEELDSDQATKFAADFDKLFNEYVAKEKERIVKKYTPKEKPKEAKKKTEFYDKVIQLSNAGAVSDQALNDTVAQIFDLPTMTPEITSKIDELVDAINAAPDGRFKNIAITKLTDYIVQQQKFNITNYLMASYKAGIFSGLDTQALNLQGNLFNVLELGFILGATNPVAAARFYKAIANPKNLSRSSLEALQVLKTGFDPRMPGDKRRVLEQTPRSFFGIGKPLKGWKQAFDPTLEQQKKFVFRALAAGDLIFSTSINDAIQNELITRQAKKKGLKGKEAQEYIRQQMGYTPENIQKWGDVAKKEAENGNIPNDPESITLRTYELIERQRDPNIVEKSREYASEQIMTNTPKGIIGSVARQLNQTIQTVDTKIGLPIMTTLIPVVNFAANAMSRAVQYMPHTAAFRAIIHGVGKKIKGENFSTQWKDFMNNMKNGDIDTEMRLRRAAIGVTYMALMIGLTDEDEEGNNLISELLGKEIKVHGFGPGTQLNRQKNYQKQETGWLPYSIQIGDKYIPYRNYPALNVLLATIGEYNDAKRYGKLARKDALERLIFALGNSFKVISEMGFLTSVNTVTTALLQGDVKSFVDLPTRAFQGYSFPKFQRNLVNLFDPKLYSRNSVQELVTRSMPVINVYANEPLVNALGEPIEKNWWDRIAIWQEKGYTKYEPIWEANNDKKYYFTIPSKFNLEQKFERQITSKEYNDYFKYRGEVIVDEWEESNAELSKEEYKAKMDELVEHADYRALVKMGVMKSDVMKEIKHQLFDVYYDKRSMQKMKESIKPKK